MNIFRPHLSGGFFKVLLRFAAVFSVLGLIVVARSVESASWYANNLRADFLSDTTETLPDSLLLAPPVPTTPDTTADEELGALDDALEFPDSKLTEFEPDTSLASDTLYIEPVDSTARVTHFQYQRIDPIVVQAFPGLSSPFFLKRPTQGVRRHVSLDSTGTVVTVRETVGDKDVKIPISMSLEDYIAGRLEHDQRMRWATMAGEYRPAQQDGGLEGLFGSFTNIDIPVPANPLFSIFGPPRINLRISGAVDIRAAFRNQKSDRVTISPLDQTRNEPDFNQEVQINLNGTIGDKLNILADWNTQRIFEYENQLKIRYTGYEDEIVRSVEAGNVSLASPSTFVGSSQALFGIKAQFQTGPLMLTTLVSQKKGQTRELTATGGATVRPFELRPHQYSTAHYFLDVRYRDFFEHLKATAGTPVLTDEILFNEVRDIEVWISYESQQPRPDARQVVAFIDLHAITATQQYPDSLRLASGIPGRVATGRFIKLRPNEYTLHEHAGYVTLHSAPDGQQAVAVAYRIRGATAEPSTDMFFGEFETADTTAGALLLKLIKPKNLLPTYRPAWDLMLKNIYSLGGRDIRKEEFELKVYREIPGGTTRDEIFGESLLKILYLDRFDDSYAMLPDGKFDFIRGLTIDPVRGEIIFPTLEPFRTNIRRFFADIGAPQDSSEYLYHDIYDTTANAAAQNSVRNRYIIRGQFVAERTSRYSLGFNVVEGSVRVLLNGTPLAPNVDYTVDYIIGEVVIRNPNALLPGANLEIKYEQNDLFQLASKTLIGARGEISPFANTNLGFTVMNLNQQTLSDKVRIGEEPTSNTIMGVDAATTVELSPLTTALNYLPLYRTREMSSLRLSGEVAHMIPDPNTKKSTIPADRGASVAYIDDFEGARRSLPLGVQYPVWKQSSRPVREIIGGREEFQPVESKAKLNWYNVLPSDVQTTDIWPERSVRRGEERITVLNLDFYPRRRGMHNYSMNLDSSLAIPQQNWNGVMRYLATTGANILEQNIGFVEIWMRADGDLTNIRSGKLYLNLGLISEQVIPAPPPRPLRPGSPHSEDLVFDDNPNGVLNQGEDVGLDMLSDEQERGFYADFLQSNIGRNPDRWGHLMNDPSGDNYSYVQQSGDYDGINGTEGNILSPEGNFPDTEDLNRNGVLDLTNSYLEYAIPLDVVYIDSSGVERENPYIVGGGQNGWYQFRIPLLDPTRVVSLANESPADILQNLQYVRMWMNGFSDDVRIRIADISLVGNQWQELIKEDSLLRVSVVNVEDNPHYKSPPGVLRERDRTQPDQEIYANEQSLALILHNLPVDSSRQAVRYFPVRPLDLFNYKQMRMFVHGDPSFVYFSETDYDAAIFLRFGSDTANFYEYRQPIRPGWEGNDVEIDFADLTAIKAQRQLSGDSIHILSPPYPVRDRPGAEYRIRGNPALTNVRYLGIGIINATGPYPGPKVGGWGRARPLSGEVWVNELRLIDVDDNPGTAYRYDAQLKLADLGNVAFNFATVDPHFHTLEQRFGSRTTSRNWGLSVNLGFEKFFPQSWQGTSVPFTYSHQEHFVRPRYLPNTDVLVDEAAGRAETPEEAKEILLSSQTFRVTDSYAVPNLRIGLPSQAWYIRDTFNKLTLSYNYSISQERNPAISQRTAWMWSGRVSYAVTLPPDYYVAPFTKLFDGVFFLNAFKDWKLYYAPTSLSAGAGVNRSRADEVPRGIFAQRPPTRNFVANRSFGFGYKLTEGGLTNISGDYSVNVESNLAHLEVDSLGRQRTSSQILRDIFFKDKFIDFGQDTRHGQRFSANSRPKIPQILGVDKFLDLTTGYSVTYHWQNNLQQGDLGKGSAYDNNYTLTIGFRLKAFTDPWFGTAAAAPPRGAPPPGRPRPAPTPGGDEKSGDTKAETPKEQQERPVGERLKSLAHTIIKKPFLDFENINISFTQTNRATHNGVVGSSGFLNFWGRVPFFQEHDPAYGPSRLYQLGLITDPSGSLRFRSQSKFPFFGFDTRRGVRAARGQLTDNFGQTNRLTFRTNRALWEGATIDLTSNVGWTFNKSTVFQTDSLGFPISASVTTSGSVERSYLSIPPVLIFKSLKSDLEDVARKYNLMRSDPSDQRSEDAKLAQAFEDGLEALPLLRRLFGPYVPRVNYVLRWDGVHRLLPISSYFDRLALEHGYNSSFTRQWRGNPDGGQRTDAERVAYAFAPLLGLNGTMKELLDGNITASIRYNTSTSYDLNVSTRNIVETFSREISVSLSYLRRGFEFFLFGLNLSNDLDIGTTFSITKNSRRTHEVATLESNPEGKPLEGSTRTILEPRIRYVLSSRVTASIFYRYTKIAPDKGGSLIPGTTTNEAGLDIHIAIQ